MSHLRSIVLIFGALHRVFSQHTFQILDALGHSAVLVAEVQVQIVYLDGQKALVTGLF